MTLYARMRAALAPLNIPIEAYVYEGASAVYGVISAYEAHGELYADNRERLTGERAQFDIISRPVGSKPAVNCGPLMQKACALLEEAGLCVGERHHDYSAEARAYRWAVRVAQYSTSNFEK